MEDKIILKMTCIGFLSIISACTSKNNPPEEIDKKQIKNEIQSKENQFAQAYNAGELKDIGYYADDAVSYYQNRSPLEGKAAIAEFLKADLALNTNSISFTTREVFVSSDANQVTELGSYILKDSANTTISSGNYMSLFEKRNGKYMCIRDMSASDGQVK